MHGSSLGNIDELAMVIEDAFRAQLTRMGYMMWDDFISPLFSVLKNVNNDRADSHEELAAMAPLVRDAMSAARKMLSEMGERRKGRYGRQPHEEEYMTPRGRAISSCIRQDMDSRYMELMSGLATIESGLEEVCAHGVNRNTNSYRRMMAVVERWYEQVNALHVVPTTVPQTSGYIEERFRAGVILEGEIPDWIDQVILNIVVTAMVRKLNQGEMIFRQNEGGILIENNDSTLTQEELMNMWSHHGGMQDVLLLVDCLCMKRRDGVRAVLMFSSKLGHGVRLSITWNAECEFGQVPDGWHAIKYPCDTAVEKQLHTLFESSRTSIDSSERTLQ